MMQNESGEVASDERESTLTPKLGLRARFRVGLTWNFLASFFNQGSTFAVSIVVANVLGRSEFGKYSIVQSTLLTVAAVAQLAMGYTANKYVAEYHTTNRERAGRVIGLCLIVTVAMAVIAAPCLFALSVPISCRVLGVPSLAPLVKLVAVIVPFVALNNLLTGALAGLENYKGVAIAGTIAGTVYLAGCTLGAYRGGIAGAVWGLGISYIVQCLYLAVALLNASRAEDVRISLRQCWLERDVLYRFALPAALNGLSTMPALWMANACLVRQNAGISLMALYSAAFSLRTLVLFVPNVVNGVGISILNNQRGMGNERQYRKVFWANLLATGCSALVGAAAVAFLGPVFLSAFGKNFAAAYPVLVILMIATILEAFAAGAYQALISQTKIWFSFFAVAVPRDSLIVVLAFLLTPRSGPVGLALAYTCGWMLALLVILAAVWRMGLQVKPAGTSLRPERV